MLLCAAQASAKGKSDAQERAAKKACAAGDYAKGVDILADLYVQTNDPTFIYNQGRCYEQNHQWTRAIDRFREFLLKGASGAPGAKADADKHIADCKSYLAEDESKTAPAPTPVQPATVQTPSTEVTVPAGPPKESIVPIPPPASPEKTSLLPVTGVVVGSVGLAAIAVGVVLNVKANDFANSGDESSQSSYKNGSLICYGVGGAALATGLVLYVLGHNKGGRSSETISILPAWTPNGAGLALGGAF